MKTMKLRCTTLLTALVTALAVFLGTLGKSEFKSQMRKKKTARQEEIIKKKMLDEEALTTEELKKK